MNEVMLKDIVSQSASLSEGLLSLRKQAAAFPREDVKRLVFTGSGDSYIAAVGVEGLARERLSGQVRACPSLDASRYLDHRPGDTVVVVSVSGEVARSIEVAERASMTGAMTIAITCNETSTLSRACDHQLVMPRPIDRSIPHSRDYTATLLALAVLIERLAGSQFAELDSWPGLVEDLIGNAFDALEETDLRPSRWWFLGAGPDRATAMFGALKFWEAAGMEAWWDDLEEFAHGSQLMARPGDYAAVIGAGPGVGRLHEMIPGLRQMGLDVVAVVPPSGKAADSVPLLTHEGFNDPVWHPFVACFPLQVLTYLEAEARSLDVSVPLFGQAHGPTYDAVHVEWTKKSQVWLDGSPLG